MIGVTLDYETADRIATATLKDHLSTLEHIVDQHLNHGCYMHPDDLSRNQLELIPALKLLISYFG